MKNKFFKIFFLILFFQIITLPSFAQCGNCNSSPFSLLYNYAIPNQVKSYVNPYFQARYAVNAVRNPRVLLSPCSPFNQVIGRNLGTGLNYGFSNPSSNNVYVNYQGLSSSSNTSENAYITGFQANDENQINHNAEPSGYFDASTNTYVWDINVSQ